MAYEPSDWEILNPLCDAGEYAEAADRARELIQVHPESAMLVYNLACYESLAGRTDDAIGHLRLAIDRKESFRSFAAEDSDFDPIRAEAAFKELVQGNAGEPTSG
jgi:tetratricopeptide (TPR) repeat protein